METGETECAESGFGNFLGDGTTCADSCPGGIPTELDFSIEDVSVCPLNDAEFQVSVAVGQVADLESFPDGSGVPISVEVVGPENTASQDRHAYQGYYPDNPHAGCENEAPPLCLGTCPKWTAGFKEKWTFVQPECGDVAGQCKCVAVWGKPPPKKESKHDGPGDYWVAVTVDPDNEYVETDETNNAMLVLLPEDALQCAGGSCCLPDGECTDVLSAFDCSEVGGDYQEDGSACATTECPVQGVCCIGNGVCVIGTEDDCLAFGGAYSGDGTTCLDAPCGAAIPTVSEWGMIVMAVLVLTAATVLFGRRWRQEAA